MFSEELGHSRLTAQNKISPATMFVTKTAGKTKPPPTTFLMLESQGVTLLSGQVVPQKSSHPHIARVCRENHSMTHDIY